MMFKKLLRKIGLGRGEAMIADHIITGAADAATGGAVSKAEEAFKAAKKKARK